jgi:hypothetical protein
MEAGKGQALTAVDFLWDGASAGLRIKKEYQPKYSENEYLKVLPQLSQGA